ncbi:MAG: general secretion pathway protein GspB [Candidatus Omnitrophota bacterium]|jgi:hypothetical protein
MHREKIIIICGLMLTGFILRPAIVSAQAEEKAKTRPAQKEALPIARPVVEYTAASFKDPFRLFKPAKEIKNIQVVEIPVNPPELRVSGLVWGAENPQAVVNGKVVKVGDIIEEARIESIGKGGIVIEFSGKKFTIPVTMNISARNNNRNDSRMIAGNRNNNTQENFTGGPQGIPQGGKNAN